MTESTTEGQGGELRKGLQWRQLFHAFRLSLSVPQILIAAGGVLALAGGQWVFAQLPFAPEGQSDKPWVWSKLVDVHPTEAGTPAIEPLVASCLRLLAIPIESVYRPAAALLRPDNDWSTAAFAWTELLYALVVWAIVGGAVTRIAVVQFSVEQSVGLRAALRFSLSRFLSFLAAPMLPGAGLLLLWMFGLVGGWIGTIPTAGPVIVGGLWFLALMVAIVMALIVVGIVGSWPLMYATISTEGSDAFDGFSRSFSYLLSRPRQWAGLSVASVIFGVISTGIGVGTAALIAYLAAWSASSGMGVGEVANLTAGSPLPLDGALRPTAAAATDSLGPSLALFWLNGLAVLVCGFAVSLFWSLSAVMYLVLRHDDDATPLNEVYLLDEEEEDELLPLVGVAASDQPAIERPIAAADEAPEQKLESASPDEKASPAED